MIEEGPRAAEFDADLRAVVAPHMANGRWSLIRGRFDGDGHGLVTRRTRRGAIRESLEDASCPGQAGLATTLGLCAVPMI